MITRQELGEKIRAFTEKKELKQYQLAEIAGISNGAMSKWINGQSSPELLNVLKICQYFNITIEDMLDLKKKCIT